MANKNLDAFEKFAKSGNKLKIRGASDPYWKEEREFLLKRKNNKTFEESITMSFQKYQKGFTL